MKLSIVAVFFLLALSSEASTREVTTLQSFDGVALSGVWTLPDAPIKGAILILPGSGNVGLTGEIKDPMLGKPYQGKKAYLSEQLAESLAANGFASLRYSKRGFEDAKQLSNQTIPYLEKDAEVALQVVKARFPETKVSILGFSEGATIAMLVANQLPVENLYLLSLPTRAIDDIFGYQFFSWPTELLKKKLDQKGTGFLEGTLFGLGTSSEISLPLMGAPWSALDADKDQKISEINELYPAYQAFYNQVRGLLQTPQYSGWYRSLLALPSFDKLAGSVQASKVYIYQAMNDAQFRWNWVLEDSHSLKVPYQIKLFPDVGHCFSPMEGSIGELKTTGPMGSELLEQLNKDILN